MNNHTSQLDFQKQSITQTYGAICYFKHTEALSGSLIH